MSVLDVVKDHEYGIATLHEALEPARVAATPAISEMFLPLPSNVAALPLQEITSAVGMVDFIEIEML